MKSSTDGASPVAVNLVMDGDTIVLSPLEHVGQEIFQSILDGGAETRRWHYMGCRVNREDNRLQGVWFACGGEAYRRVEGNISEADYRGAIKVYLDLSSVEEVAALRAIRGYGYYGGGVTLKESSIARRMFLENPNACKICKGNLRNQTEMEWKVCDACSKVCDHVYKWGVGQSDNSIAYLRFCNRCGRGDPTWEADEDPMIDAIRTVTDGPLVALALQHPDNTTTLITKA